jgi:hypothetical protein
MERFAKPGDFCPNPACAEYGKRQDGEKQTNIRKFGKTRRGVQRYQCRTCQQTFTETTGTFFYGKQDCGSALNPKDLHNMASGVRLSSSGLLRRRRNPLF